MRNVVLFVLLLLATGAMSYAQEENNYRSGGLYAGDGGDFQVGGAAADGILKLWIGTPYVDETGDYTVDYDLKLGQTAFNWADVRHISFYMKVTETIEGAGGGFSTISSVMVPCNDFEFCEDNTSTVCYPVPMQVGVQHINIDTPDGICDNRRHGYRIASGGEEVKGVVNRGSVEMTLALNQLRPSCGGNPLNFSYKAEGWDAVVTMANGDELELHVMGMERSSLYIACHAKTNNRFAEGEELMMEVSPNPATDRVQLDVEGNGALTLMIANLAGQVLQEEAYEVLGAQRLFLDLDQFESGVYIIHLTDGKTVRKEKLVIMD